MNKRVAAVDATATIGFDQGESNPRAIATGAAYWTLAIPSVHVQCRPAREELMSSQSMSSLMSRWTRALEARHHYLLRAVEGLAPEAAGASSLCPESRCTCGDADGVGAVDYRVPERVR